MTASRARAKRVRGSIKEAIGKITGDTKTQAEGDAEKNAGKAERPWRVEGQRPRRAKK